jgi:hypothetical protein
VRLIPVVLASMLEMCFNAQIPLSVKFIIDRALLGHNMRAMVGIRVYHRGSPGGDRLDVDRVAREVGVRKHAIYA